MKDILASIEGGVAHLTINRPEARNALRPQTMDEMLEFLRAVEDNADVGAVILKAAGPHFISGGDVMGFKDNAARETGDRGAFFEALAHRMNPLLLAIERLPQMVIASVRGYVAGSGLSLVAAADLAIASDNAKFMLSHIKIGGTPDAGATYHLPLQVGLKRAKEIICLGDTFDAAEALRIGLLNRVVADDQLETVTAQLAGRLGNGPRLAIAAAKRLVNQSPDNSLAAQLNEEARAVGRVVRTEDFLEGLRAFAEKRPPVYRGR
jgi:2-(1,2-epoxy-1,2-dihydrophenyl)acetyl-CoA isomerase